MKELMVNFKPLMFATIGIYIFAVYYGQKWMESRPAYNLKIPLFFWNAGLCVFSIVATVRGGPELLFLLAQPDGVYRAVCDRVTHNYATSFWLLMIVLSKVVELGDTAFIVLRKQKLIVLHWYHHAATLLMCWYGHIYHDPFGRFLMVNTFVHSFMYAYYALRALKVQIPRKLSMALTTLQILQIAFCGYANYVSMSAMSHGLPCNRDWEYIYIAVGVVFSVLILFINFYISTYFGRKKVKSQ
jgi:elongation of very long chain fatty acids protein 6